MWCLRTLGVLSVTFSLVWSMTLETTSPRYTEDFRISLGLNVPNSSLVDSRSLSKLDSKNSTHLFKFNNTKDTLINVNESSKLDVIHFQRYVISLNTSLVISATDVDLNASKSNNYLNSSLRNEPKEASLDVGESRKIKSSNKKLSQKQDAAVSNFIKTTLKELKQNITSFNDKNGKIKQQFPNSSNPIKTTNRPLPTKITTIRPSFKIKLSSLAPIAIKLTKPTTKRPIGSTPKSYHKAGVTRNPPAKSNTSTSKKPQTKIKVTTPTSKTKPKPTIKKIITQWKDSETATSDLKQNWYEGGVPYPNPFPEITSSSPPFSISDSGSQIFSSSTTENIFVDEIQPAVEQGVESISPEIISYSPSEPLQGVPPILPQSSEDLESVSVPASDTAADTGGNPISTFNLDMIPAGELTRDPSSGNPCPTVHIASSVLSQTPLETRQGCSDLNLVLNTHYHQNQDTRNPVNTYDASAPGEEDIVEADPGIEDGLGNAGPTGVASDPGTYQGAAPGGGSPGGGTGGSGGSGGSGGDGGGNDGGFKLPDLKPMFEALGYLMRGLWWLIKKLMNPWLYIVPIVLFFKLGFLGILALFPWWIPFLFLYLSVRTDEPKHEVPYVKHHHKPVVIKHHDRWYWDQHTKTWKDVLHPHGYGYKNHRSDESDPEADTLDDEIIRLGDRYLESNNLKRKIRKRRSTPTPTTNNTNGNFSIQQVVDTNTSTMAILDVRTPPKIQSQIKDRISSKFTVESSHAGVAIPMDEDLETLEESTKKMNFYKLDRPTTTSNGGFSTWILLSGQTASTSPKSTTKKSVSVKPIIMKDEKNNETLMLGETPMKMVKPVFKPRSTTLKPSTTSLKTTTTVRVNTFSPSPKNNVSRKPTKLTKTKASLLQNAANNKLNNSTTNNQTQSNSNIDAVTSNTTKAPPKISHISTTANTKLSHSTTEKSSITNTTDSSAMLPAEAKDGGQDLLTNEDQTKKKKSQKRKKNKGKKRKPSKSSKEGDSKLKESPGTQLYSYLRSEIIPVTVGVSLVGLLVTAGLASYYLQPFAALRRNDPIDRKDTEGSYFYHDDYSNAMPEEEAIGKVIAGMPENTLNGGSNANTYKQPTSRNTYPQNVRYRHVDRRSQIYMNPYGSVEDVKLTDRTTSSPGYSNYNQPASRYSNDQKFVVGNIPKEVIQDATPAVVPEHGPRYLKDEEKKFVVGNIPKEFFSAGASPRNLKIRRRRQTISNDADNEISPEENEIDGVGAFIQTNAIPSKVNATTINYFEETNSTEKVSTEMVKDTTPHNVFNPNERPGSFLQLLSDLFRFKVRLGLELLQNVTNTVQNYASKVRTRLDEHYKRVTRGNSTRT